MCSGHRVRDCEARQNTGGKCVAYVIVSGWIVPCAIPASMLDTGHSTFVLGLHRYPGFVRGVLEFTRAVPRRIWFYPSCIYAALGTWGPQHWIATYGRADTWGGVRDFVENRGAFSVKNPLTGDPIEYSNRRPLIGFYDLMQQPVVDAEIQMAAHEGIEFFSFTGISQCNWKRAADIGADQTILFVKRAGKDKICSCSYNWGRSTERCNLLGNLADNCSTCTNRTWRLVRTTVQAADPWLSTLHGDLPQPPITRRLLYHSVGNPFADWA